MGVWTLLERIIKNVNLGSWVKDMNYEIVPLNGQGVYDLNGVRFNNRQNTFTYWKNKSTVRVRGVMVVFDDKYVERQIPDGVMMLSLKGLKGHGELVMAVKVFKDIMAKQNIDVLFRFVVSNDAERQVAEAVAREAGVKYDINVVNQMNNNQLNNQRRGTEEQKREENVNKLEEGLKKNQVNQDVNAYGSKTIETNNNGVNRRITINGDKAYVNSGMLSIEEEKFLLLQEWKNDPYKSAMIASKTAEEIDRMLLETVALGKKEHMMTSSSEQTVIDDASRVAMNKASQEDGKVNSELGIVENGVYNSNQYSAAERDGDNVRIVNTSVTSTNINSGGVSSNSSDGSVDDNYNQAEMKEEEENSREAFDENKVYYIDEEYNILEVVDEKSITIGRVGYNGYGYDSVNNVITKNGKPQAYVGDIRDMDREKSNTQSKPKVRTLQKKENNDDNKGFATLPVIMFIISALLLIASVILLFVLD